MEGRKGRGGGGRRTPFIVFVSHIPSFFLLFFFCFLFSVVLFFFFFTPFLCILFLHIPSSGWCLALLVLLIFVVYGLLFYWALLLLVVAFPLPTPLLLTSHSPGNTGFVDIVDCCCDLSNTPGCFPFFSFSNLAYAAPPETPPARGPGTALPFCPALAALHTHPPLSEPPF